MATSIIRESFSSSVGGAGDSGDNSKELIDVNKHKIVVVIPAAGTSERFCETQQNNKSIIPNNKNKHEPKQYQIICGKPLIYHTLCAFLR